MIDNVFGSDISGWSSLRLSRCTKTSKAANGTPAEPWFAVTGPLNERQERDFSPPTPVNINVFRSDKSGWQIKQYVSKLFLRIQGITELL